MARQIRKVAVLGAGVMGSGIAAHLASCGVRVILFDIVPPNLTDAEKGDRAARNRWAQGGLDKALTARPALFLDNTAAALIEVGNLTEALNGVLHRTCRSSSRVTRSSATAAGGGGPGPEYRLPAVRCASRSGSLRV
jgi:glycerol-3-phosphate dehydrogenase